MNSAKKVSDGVYEIPKEYKQGMNVPARIYASERILNAMDDGVFDQITNVACLPGIQKYACCMPDGHWGYGFPIGGVGAFDSESGVISPGGIGFDINCGIRLVTTSLTLKDVQPKMKELVDTLFRIVPAGVGAKGFVRLNHNDFHDAMVDGVRWCVDNGYGVEADFEHAESNGRLPGADPNAVSDRAKNRGISQLGTLGSGNHFLEIQHAASIFDEEAAKTMGITEPDQVTVMVHCGSRGLGHQIATDFLKVFEDAMPKYGITVKDRQLACAPFKSEEGQKYYNAMACAANMAFANRQVIIHKVREGFRKIFGNDAQLDTVYDVAHNIAKVEEHDGKKLLVHRKGSTRAFGPGHPEIPQKYQQTGQPVLLGGSMETGSYVLAGTEKAMKETFGSTAHGSGRTMSRSQAKRQVRGDQLQRDMERRGIYVKAVSMAGLAEEAGLAYKNVSDVVAALEESGISKKVYQLKPVGNIKG